MAGFELPELEWVEAERELVLRGKGGTSSGVWLNLLTRSFKEVCRFRDVLVRAGFDLTAFSGDGSEEVVEAYLEACGVYAREVKGEGLEEPARDEGGLCLR